MSHWVERIAPSIAGVRELLKQPRMREQGLPSQFAFLLKMDDREGTTQQAGAVAFSRAIGSRAALWPDWTFFEGSSCGGVNHTSFKATLTHIRASQPPASLRREGTYWRGSELISGGWERARLHECSRQNHSFVDVKAMPKTLEGKRENVCHAQMCGHTFNLYMEGARAWSVSLKFLLACGSVLLWVNPMNEDFISQALERHVHYVPVRDSCDEIATTARSLTALQRGALAANLSSFALDKLSMTEVRTHRPHPPALAFRSCGPVCKHPSFSEVTNDSTVAVSVVPSNLESYVM
mmetsp:Transcript_36514/g.106905  ORF Transcript_36514/g.106905 Transcript_36514/m.106905 type:complete len:294 (+) Transcript_36514:275-1156(+)|eukprot:2728162-Prymnesium_polylepis.2